MSSPTMNTRQDLGGMRTEAERPAHTPLRIADAVERAWSIISPFWPLKNLIAVNPLRGLEDLPFEDALIQGASYFQRTDLPAPMEAVNRETIKWLQAFCDEGQATLPMPLRAEGLYKAWKQLAIFDTRLHSGDPQKIAWLESLPDNPDEAIANCMTRLGIAGTEQQQFLTLMLTSLPGWAGYVKYRTEWAGLDTEHPHPITQSGYLAMRTAIAFLIWPGVNALLEWHSNGSALDERTRTRLKQIQKAEAAYRLPLLQQIAAQPVKAPEGPEAQLVFCIDVRSEPFRRALESTGNYQTYGFAGFFGLPIKIVDAISSQTYASCPVLLAPQHEVIEQPCGHEACERAKRGYERLSGLKRLYQSVKYTFTAPFALVEGVGLACGAWMGLRSLAPGVAARFKNLFTEAIGSSAPVTPSLVGIPFERQCAYAEGALKMMGLTERFAPLVVFCGHGSTTQNNAYASSLDCGACGGRHGGSNARVLAAILNRADVRLELIKKGIDIPDTTRFLAAEHNTTTDEVVLDTDLSEESLKDLKRDLEVARQVNSAARLGHMHIRGGDSKLTWLRAQDWAQVRPEWGLARNAAFIVAPRELTQSIDLEGRAFLHSYDHRKDQDGSSLRVILTAPMVVAQWINTQYLFSTIDNIAYGGGSKVTSNVSGKLGIMQGNASDLMTGLPLQSVFSTDSEAYHEPLRLMTVVYAPRAKIDTIIEAQPILRHLFGNGWVQLSCIEPTDRTIHLLDRDLQWQQVH